MRGKVLLLAIPAHVSAVTTLIATADSFDPDAITPVHVVAAIVLNLVWAGLAIRDRRQRARTEQQQNPE